MKSRNEHAHKNPPSAGVSVEKNPEWWKVTHPHPKQVHSSTAFTTNVKTGMFKTYNVRNSGKK